MRAIRAEPPSASLMDARGSTSQASTRSRELTLIELSTEGTESKRLPWKVAKSNKMRADKIEKLRVSAVHQDSSS